jgi:hypothetical protein
MSIAVGFNIFRSVVLCADRQMTKEGGLKFEGSKLKWQMSLTTEEFYNLAFAFCGDPDVAHNIYNAVARTVSHAVREATPELTFPEYYRTALLPVFKTKEAKQIETLIAIQTREPCFLFRTKTDQVVTAHMECIGSGDSSVIRYIADAIATMPLPREDGAEALAIYMVSLANRYIDGCGFGADAVVMQAEKPMRVLTKADTAKYSERFRKFERQMEKEFFTA